MNAIQIFAPIQTARVRYIFSLIFEEMLGLEIQYISDFATHGHKGLPVINYSETEQAGIQVFPQGLLFHKEIFEQTIIPFDYKGHPAFFRTTIGDFPFDLFSASFYLVSRYEEYLPHIADVHGRFQVKDSLAHRLGFLRTPLINFWVETFADVLKARFPTLQITPPTFSFISSIDVDNAFAYRGKGLFRTSGAIAKDIGSGNFTRLRQRFSTLIGLKKDPYDTLSYQLQLQQTYKFTSIYFVLFAPFGENDRNLSPQSHLFQRYIKSLNDFASIGLHPSYQSHQSTATPLKEKAGLESIINQKVTVSRQHYLKMQLPQTMRRLSEMGITDDYSMGYAATPGFRASICQPFYFYDLELEEALPLRVHPLPLMDVTYIDYQCIDPATALHDILDLLQIVKRFSGEFVSVWHNRTFSEEAPQWKGWNAVYESMIAAACQ